MKRLLSRSRMTAAIAGCALLAAAGGAGVSFAWFGDVHASTGNSAQAGTIDLVEVPSTTTSLLPTDPAQRVRPGGAAMSGIQTLTNSGTLAGDLSVRVTEVAKLTANNLSDVLRLAVDECTTGTGSTCGSPVNRHDGLLKDATSAISLGTLSPSAQKRIRIRVYWPATADNSSLYNDEMGFRLSWQLRTSA